MAVLEILKFPDPRLRKKCTPINQMTPELLQLADDMLETMYTLNGLGLSAIQVNHFVRLLTADTSSLAKAENKRYEKTELGKYEKIIQQPVVLFNPEIISQTGKVIFKEGCLSFPSYYADIQRAAYVEVQGINPSGKKITIKTDGVLAICIQHEIDHLNGKLFIDHLSPVKANQLRAQIKKYGYPDPTQKSRDS